MSDLAITFILPACAEPVNDGLPRAQRVQEFAYVLLGFGIAAQELARLFF